MPGGVESANKLEQFTSQNNIIYSHVANQKSKKTKKKNM